jgi:hypothetical protein
MVIIQAVLGGGYLCAKHAAENSGHPGSVPVVNRCTHQQSPPCHLRAPPGKCYGGPGLVFWRAFGMAGGAQVQGYQAGLGRFSADRLPCVQFP